MRICFFVGSLSLGGIGKLTLNLTEEFIKRGIEVDLFLLRGDGEYIEQIPDKARVFIAEGNNIIQLIKFGIYLVKENPDISISARQRQSWGNIIACLLSFTKTKPIISVHTNISEENKRLNKRSRFTAFLTRLLYKVPQNFIAVSQGVADDLVFRTGVNKANVKVIYNPVYVEAPKKNKNSSIIEPCEYLIKNNKKFIISAARFTEQKDLFTLVNAFKLVRKELDISLVILGDGPQREKIEELIDSLSLEQHVILTGYVDNPEYFISNASVYVLSSKWEGFGNVLVEAMGVGTPVVSTNCPSGPAEILKDGEYGELVPVESPQKMARAIIRTLQRPVLPQKLRRRAKDFSLSKIADEYLKLINEEIKYI